MNAEQYELSCAADIDFYDSPGRLPDEAGRFRVAGERWPAGWRRTDQDYWVVLVPTARRLPEQGWKVHVSVRPEQAAEAIETVAAFCRAHEVAFKFLRSETAVRLVNAKHADRTMSGKAITVYPRDEDQLTTVLAGLSGRLAGIEGPAVVGDLRFGKGPLFLRYGAFVALECVTATGERVPAIRRPDGVLEPDPRGVAFTLPRWAPVPAVLAAHLAAHRAGPPELPYEVVRTLRASNAGGVHLAKDPATGEKVVLREARPHAGLDARGRDAVARLQAEKRALTRLAGLDCVPRLLGSFTAGDHHFLVTEHIEGDTLFELSLTLNPLSDPLPPDAARAAYRDGMEALLDRVERAVAAVHRRGIAWGDGHPSNVVVRPDGSVVLVDFECATDLDDEGRMPMGAIGFAPPGPSTAADRDQYAVDMTRLAVALPMAPALVQRDRTKAGTLATAARKLGVLHPATADRLTRTLGADEDLGADMLLGEWPSLRDALVAGILDAATPWRHDRLFPGDPAQGATGGIDLAYGAAGVLTALHAAGVTVPPQHVDWLARATRRAAGSCGNGLYTGVLGAAATLAALGRPEEAAELVDEIRTRPAPLTVDLAGGAAGIGIGLLHLAARWGDESLREAALRLGDRVAAVVDHDRTADLPRPAGVGLLRGMAGPALFLLHLYADTADQRYLDLAGRALRADLQHCVRFGNSAMYVRADGRHLSHLDGGTGGIAVVLHHFLRLRPDDELAEAMAAAALGCTAAMSVEPGLFRGRAGLMTVLRLVQPDDIAPVRTHLHRLGWYAVRRGDALLFPGTHSMRFSTDFATGSAGVLYAATAAVARSDTGLPFLDPPVVADRVGALAGWASLPA